MNNNRRKFLVTAGTVGLTTALMPGAVVAQMQPFRNKRVLTRDSFDRRTKDWFYLHNADDTHQGNLQLIQIMDAGSNTQVEQFTLVLRSYRQAVPMPSGYYRVAGEKMSLFVKHVEEVNGRHIYQADFALLQ